MTKTTVAACGACGVAIVLSEQQDIPDFLGRLADFLADLRLLLSKLPGGLKLPLSPAKRETYRRGSTGSLSSARTAKAHSWTL